jgi:hypothetical protein
MSKTLVKAAIRSGSAVGGVGAGGDKVYRRLPAERSKL